MGRREVGEIDGYEIVCGDVKKRGIISNISSMSG